MRAGLAPAAEPELSADSLSQSLPGPDPGCIGTPDVEMAFEAVFGKGATQAVTPTTASAADFDQAAVRELFTEIAAAHARPVRNLVFELKRGTATREWIEICRPVMETLARSAESMDLPEVAKKMIDLNAALSLAAAGDGPTIEAGARDLILSCYEEMAEALPESFRRGDEERRRESIIIHSLLKQVPDVGHVTFQRLYGAGLTSLESLFLATAEDLALTAGIPEWLCERICQRMQAYRHQLARERDASGEGERREHLRRLVDDLRRKHKGYERASSEEWTDPQLAEQKRELREARQACALQIEVLLADLGEVELAERIQRLPMGLRLEALGQFVESAEGAPLTAQEA